MVLRPKLLNIPFASCFLINLDILASHIAHFDNIIVLPLLVFITFGFILSVFFHALSNKIREHYFILITVINNFIAFNNFINAYFFTLFS